jgi:hypothetical protein
MLMIFLKTFNKKVPKIVFLKLRIENNVSLFCAQVPHIQFLVDLVAMTLLLLHYVHESISILLLLRAQMIFIITVFYVYHCTAKDTTISFVSLSNVF